MCEGSIRSLSDRVMAIVLVFEEDVLKLVCWYTLQSGGSLKEKNLFIMS